MRLGGPGQRFRDNAEAHADPRVAEVAKALSRGSESLLSYAVRALGMVHGPLEDALDLSRDPLGLDDRASSIVVDNAMSAWRAEGLRPDQIQARKGAVIEQLAAILLRSRTAPKNISAERRVFLTNGHRTHQYDVVRSAGPSNWEAYECKSYIHMRDDQGADISDDAAESNKNGGELLIIVASAADRTSLLPVLRAKIKDAHLVRFVDARNFYSIAVRPPVDRVF